jgi:anti-anti-sigma factor
MASLENFSVRWAGPRAVVALPPEVDISNADLVSDTLLAVLNRGVGTLVADMTGTRFCACAGVTALVRAQQRAATNRAEIRVAATTPIVLRVLALTGADRMLPVFGTVGEALAEAGAGERTPGPEDEDPAPMAVS